MASTAIQIIARGSRVHEVQKVQKVQKILKVQRVLEVPVRRPIRGSRRTKFQGFIGSIGSTNSWESLNPENLVNLENPVFRSILVDRARLAAAIVPAIGAHTVRRLVLVAMRAFAQAGGLERIMRTALGRSRLGVASFWIRHRESLSIDRGDPVRVSAASGDRSP
jgi:hypothetical protein